MRSPTEVRVWGERVLRAIGIGALALACWLAWFPGTAARVTDAPRWVPLPEADALAQRLVASSGAPPWLSLSAVPEQARRALLQAGVHAGVPVSWRAADGAVLPALALSAAASADPTGGLIVRAAAPPGVALELADSLGWIDSTTSAQGGATWRVPGAPRAVRVQSAGTRAMAEPAPPIEAYRVRLYGAPGWESRFTAVALEESGWTVDAAFTIAPRVLVRSGRPETLDTARYRAVVALDSTAWADAAAIARFVRSGGGLVLLADAAVGAPASLPVAGRLGPLNAAVPGALRTATPLEGVPLRALTGLLPGSVALERSDRSGAPVRVAARTVGAGRVVQAGLSGLWEWRMLGGDDAVEAHRDWWGVMLQRAASTAPARQSVLPSAAWAGPGDAAPLADLVARLGPADSAPRVPSSADVTTAGLPAWLLLAALVALVGEWWSRRLRGAR
jgi:hypothetical protein